MHVNFHIDSHIKFKISLFINKIRCHSIVEFM